MVGIPFRQYRDGVPTSLAGEQMIRPGMIDGPLRVSQNLRETFQIAQTSAAMEAF